MKLTHPFPPLFDDESRILILGSFPSVKSREQNFFYGHPQNRFWKVTAAVFAQAEGAERNGMTEADAYDSLTETTIPETVEEKKAFLHAHHIALWDVIASCEIEGSSDASIRNVTANDLSPILKGAPIERIFTNGGTAYDLYCRYIWPGKKARQDSEAARMAQTGRSGLEAIKLPSTSPANAAWTLERLIEAWRVIAR